MSSREFTDSQGVVWRVWDVKPSFLHPATRGEEFMSDYSDGWLTFESPTQKRRLPAPYPSKWVEYDLRKLEALCRAARPVTSRTSSPGGQRLAQSEDSAELVERADAERTFASPRGRIWRVRLHECLRKDGSASVVLRFTAGDSVVDLNDWPPSWKELDRDGFALLLLDAEPPRRLGVGERPQRRREDRPEL